MASGKIHNDSAVQTITLTASANLNAIGTSTKAYRVGRLVIVHMYSQIIANVAGSADLISGLPAPLSTPYFVLSTNVGNYSYRAKITSNGVVQTEGAFASTQSWYAGSVVYISAS